jgi:ribosomal protein S18 acetylase RimI-like enzyme
MAYARPFLQLSIYEDLRNRIRSKGQNYLCLVAFLVRDTQPTQGLSAIGEQNLVGTVEISVRSRNGTDVISFHSWQLDSFEYVYLCNLAVDENYRRLGVAQKLLYSCERQVLEWGFCDLYLHVLENNYTARRLYYRAGYRLQEVQWTWGSLLLGQPRKLFLHKHISPNIN